MNLTDIHVVIIGAGLGGLSLAQGLKKRGVRFDVYEKDTTSYTRSQSFRLRIDHTGQEALSQCLLESHYKLFENTCGEQCQGMHRLNSKLENTADEWIESWTPPAEERDQQIKEDLAANRLTMREVLLCGLKYHVHFDKVFVQYEERDDGKVVAHFSDGSTVVSDVLIAADGANSTVRKQRFPELQTYDTGIVCIYGKTYPVGRAKESIAKILQSGTSVIMDDDLVAVAENVHFKESPAVLAPALDLDYVVNPVDDYIYWAVLGKRKTFGLGDSENITLSVEDISRHVANVVETWNPSLKALFSNVDMNALAIAPMRSARPQEPWVSSRVTALGDAVHLMSLIGGLGGNTTLYDAAVLADKLADVQSGKLSMLDAIADYEEKMRAQSAASIQSSLAGSEKLFPV
ncbi:MAG: FAD-dependent monooxygenase [Burkholderiales bacterium]|nr:FAD-dependent monooxygenase [Burkholderiales bacterium]